MKYVWGALVALGFLASGCSDGDDEAERALVVEWLVDHEETPARAECLADELSDYAVADFDALAAVSDDSGFDEGFKSDVDAALETCAES